MHSIAPDVYIHFLQASISFGEDQLRQPEFKLAIDFSDVPTKSQLVNMCRDISKFLNNVGASLIIDEQYMANEPQCGGLLNVATELKKLSDMIDNPNNNSGLVQAQPAPPHMMPRR